MAIEGLNLLVLLMEDGEAGALREAIAARADPVARVHVVAPALVGPLAWLATAEDEAHHRAEVRALEAEWTLADQAEVDGEAGDVDPIQAVEDALRDFTADEILIAGVDADDELAAALGGFGIPVGRLEQGPYPRRSGVYRALRGLAGGHREATPFILFLGVNAAFLLVAVLLSLLVVLVLWLVGAL